MDKSIWLYMNFSKKKKWSRSPSPSLMMIEKKESFIAFALQCVTFVCICFRKFQWEKVNCDAICRPIRLFMGGLKTFGFFIFIFLEYTAFIHVAVRWPSSFAEYASATTYRIIEGNDIGYIDVCQWWFQPQSVSTIKEDKIELRRNMVPSKKQPWCQGMPPLLLSFSEFIGSFIGWVFIEKSSCWAL